MVEHESKYDNDNPFQRKPDSKESIKSSEKEISLLKFENKELKENYMKIREKLNEMNRKIAISNIKLDEV